MTTHHAILSVSLSQLQCRKCGFYLKSRNFSAAFKQQLVVLGACDGGREEVTTWLATTTNAHVEEEEVDNPKVFCSSTPSMTTHETQEVEIYHVHEFVWQHQRYEHDTQDWVTQFYCQGPSLSSRQASTAEETLMTRPVGSSPQWVLEEDWRRGGVLKKASHHPCEEEETTSTVIDVVGSAPRTTTCTTREMREMNDRCDRVTPTGTTPQGWRSIPSTQEMTHETTLGQDDTSSPLPRRKRLLMRRRTLTTPQEWLEEFITVANAASPVTADDFPQCHRCAAETLSALQSHILTQTKELRQYRHFITQQHQTTLPQDSTPLKPLQTLETENASYHTALENVRTERQTLEQTVKSLRYALERRQQQEQVWLNKLAETSVAATVIADDRASLSRQRQDLHHRASLLTKYNSINDAFFIWHDGQFGTINGCRLGRLPPHQPVDWIEINAALGQVVLVLDTILSISATLPTPLVLTCLSLHPHGSFSTISETIPSSRKVSVSPQGSSQPALKTTTSTWPLYSDTASSLSVWSLLKSPHKRFNRAMVLLLRALEAMGLQATEWDPSFVLPYLIEIFPPSTTHRHGHGYPSVATIHGLSIMVASSYHPKPEEDAQWTKALKYALTHVKWLLSWVIRQQRRQKLSIIDGGGALE